MVTIKDFSKAVDNYIKNRKNMSEEEREKYEAKLRGMENVLREKGIVI